ncbi:fatty acid--CoA ligase [Actinocorallia lasiicapitis]
MEYRVADIVRRFGAERPQAPAITGDGRTVTYGELDARSNQVGQALLAEGFGPGARIGYLGKNAPEFFDVLFGAAKTGAVLTPVNWRLTPREIGAVLDDAGAALTIVDRELAGLDLPGRKIVTGPAFEGWLAARPADDPGYTGSPDDVVAQLYTSGTTGLPKGVPLTNRNFSVGVRRSAAWRMTGDSVNLVPMPLFHVGGTGYALTGLYPGGHHVLVRDVRPAELADTIVEFGVTHSFIVPAVLRAMCDLPEPRAYSTLRAIGYGASPITTELLHRVLETFKAPLFQSYGMTETTGTIVQLDPDDHASPYLMRSAGRPYPWVELRIVDPATGESLAAGETGEVWVRSHQNTSGYWNRPAETERLVTPDGWLRTGDAGHLDRDGYLFLTDRIKDMIVTGGENVYPVEIEEVLSAHPGIADVAVIGVPDEKWGETVLAVVVRADPALTEREVLEHGRAGLAGFKRPRRVVFAATLPRNPGGKVLKKELRAPYWTGTGRDV